MSTEINAKVSSLQREYESRVSSEGCTRLIKRPEHGYTNITGSEITTIFPDSKKVDAMQPLRWIASTSLDPCLDRPVSSPDSKVERHQEDRPIGILLLSFVSSSCYGDLPGHNFTCRNDAFTARQGCLYYKCYGEQITKRLLMWPRQATLPTRQASRANRYTTTHSLLRFRPAAARQQSSIVLLKTASWASCS